MSLTNETGALLLANLIINAQHAMESHTGVRALTITTSLGSAGIVVEISDTGPGISEEQRHRVFEPFFTTRPIGAGTGLGLSFACNVAAAHGGRLSLASSVQRARFMLELPLGDQVQTPIAETAADIHIKGRALIVDHVFNLDTHRLFAADGSEVAITAMEFDMLRVFAQNPGKVLSRDRILDLAHHRDMEAFERTVDTRIVRLRHKIERDPAFPQIIKTVPGAGYIFVPQGHAPAVDRAS